jgi:hypothetical protein
MIKIKDNIKGKITKGNINYKTPKDARSLPRLFPQEDSIDSSVVHVKQNRVRYDKFPDRLPNNDGEMPYPPDEHEMIGQYEFPHNTYLILAHAYNKAMERIEALEKEVESLKKGKGKNKVE